jgi:hypothetical protein
MDLTTLSSKGDEAWLSQRSAQVSRRTIVNEKPMSKSWRERLCRWELEMFEIEPRCCAKISLDGKDRSRGGRTI